VSFLCASALLSAQSWPTIPPIPPQERFRPRTDLAVTLRLDAVQRTAGTKPAFAISLRNTGPRPVRVPPFVSLRANVRLRLFDGAGRELDATSVCVVEPSERLDPVRHYARLVPGEARTFPLTHACDEFPLLRPGDYQLEATYWSYPDRVFAYDVYEDTAAADVWNGRVVAPRISFTVLPLDAGTEHRLTTLLDDGGSPDGLLDAVRQLGLGGSAAATAALIRRFERDADHRVELAWALERIADETAPAALAAAIERLSADERALFQMRRATGHGFAVEAVVASPVRPSERRFDDRTTLDRADVQNDVIDVINGSSDWLAVKAIGIFGTVQDFLRLKAAFDSRADDDRGALEQALVAMAFVSDKDLDSTAASVFWDAWWKAHARMTRVQWAREALHREPLRSRTVPHDEAPSRAAEFLLAEQGVSPALVRELARHRSWLVRLTLADAVAQTDEQSSGRLMIRELSNRDLSACIGANQRLEQLVRRSYVLDCADPVERERAITHWTDVIDRMEPGSMKLVFAP
jgi:hypothetical protein